MQPNALRSAGFRRGLFTAVLAVTLLSPFRALAQDLEGHFGDWILMADDRMSLALTTDGGAAAFGLLCGPDCFIYIESAEPCSEGRDYPARIEAGSGAYELTMTCKRSDGGVLLTMPHDAPFMRLIDGQDSVRFTIPREDGKPSQFRFPLAGSAKAIGLALAARAYIKALDSPGLSRDAPPSDGQDRP